jgi:hypothetical protein
MKPRLAAAVTMLVAAIIFWVVGFRTVPKNNSYVILGIVFAVLAARQFRRARMR